MNLKMGEQMAQPVAVGIDILEVPRMSRFMEQYGTGGDDRVFTEGEWGYVRGKVRAAEHLAARFAAKEAFLKAMGTGLRGEMSLRDIEVCSTELGRPAIVLHGETERLFRERGGGWVQVSLSHQASLAVAVVIIGWAQGLQNVFREGYNEP